MLSQIEPNIQTRVAVIVIHRHALTFEILKTINAESQNEIIFAPGIIALCDMDVRISVEGPPSIEIVVVTRNDVKLTFLQSLGGTFALSFQRTKIHLQTRLFQTAALLHHLP